MYDSGKFWIWKQVQVINFFPPFLSLTVIWDINKWKLHTPQKFPKVSSITIEEIHVR